MKTEDEKYASHRKAAATHARKVAAQEADIAIGEPENWPRRRAAVADVYVFLETYFPKLFNQPWTSDRREMIDAILFGATYGGDQAIAAPRGEGKTSIASRVALYLICTGKIRFVVLIAASDKQAAKMLRNIKLELEGNSLLLADFPEICQPIRSLDGKAQRARGQTCGGKLTNLVWGKNELTFAEIDAEQSPATQGSAASGAVMMCYGKGSAVRGLGVRELRPDMVILDDIDTRGSGKSEVKTEDDNEMIEQDIAGLSGPGKNIARIMLCTVISEQSTSFTFTDRAAKPSWNGKRFKLLVTPPTRADLWEQYVALRQKGQESNDRWGREAHAFYLANREAMDAGAVVSNPHRFNPSKLADGTQKQVSALQSCYDMIADRGWENFAKEYQNEPPISEKPTDSGLTAAHVRSQLNGFMRGVVPAGCQALTAGIDIGKHSLHYAVVAWRAGAKGSVIDYGVQEVYNADDRGPEVAVLHALRTLRDAWRENPYPTEEGEKRAIDVALIDAGYLDTAVNDFVRESGVTFRACKGFGTGYKQSPFSAPSHHAKEKYAGEHWYASLVGNIWLHGLDDDHWKRWTQERFLVPVTEPGSLSLYGNDARPHVAFSHHIVAEVEKEEFVPGKGVKRYFDRINPNNHWLDATKMAAAAANMVGVRLLLSTAVPVPSPVSKPAEPQRRERSEGGWASKHKGRWS